MPRDYSLDGQLPIAHQRIPEFKRDDDWIRALLRRTEVGILASRWDDQPFVAPTSFWFDEANHRIIFHSNIAGRMRANLERHPKVSFVVFESGKFLPSNIALEFSVQYRSAMVFGSVEVIQEPDKARRVLNGLIQKYFPEMEPGREYRPITDKELAHTSVYALKIDSWSGKENWQERAEQSDEWPALDAKWFE